MKKLNSAATITILISISFCAQSQTPNTSPLPAGETVIGNHLHAGQSNEVWTDASTLYFNYRGNATTTHFWNQAGTSGKAVLTMLSNGSVGVGTTSPSAKLEINQTGGGSGQNVGAKIWAGNNSSYFGNSQIQFSWGGGGSAYSHAIKTRHNSSGILSNAIDFYLWQPGDPVNGEGTLNVMSLNGGNVGIGTAAPSSRLHLTDNNHIGWGSVYIETTGGTYSHEAGISYNGNGTGKGGDGSWFVGSGIGGIGYGDFAFWHNPIGAGSNYNAMVIQDSGNVGIGTTTPGSYKLAVEGKIGAREVNVTAANPWPDFVFERNYKLPSLDEVKNYIDQNQHLPEVPSAKEVEKNGVNLGEMNALFLKKIEELTLHLIEQNKKTETLNKMIAEMKRDNFELRKEIEDLKTNK